MKRDLLRDLGRMDGLARLRQLAPLGYSSASLRVAKYAGLITSPRRGWVAGPSAPTAAVRAVHLGGRLGGGSALESYGVWTDSCGLVVATNTCSSRLPATREDETRLWTDDEFPESSDRQWRVSVVDALLQHGSCVDRSSLIASIDSAIYTRNLTRTKANEFFALLPDRLQSVRRDVDGAAMSGTETKLRLALRAAGLRVESQVALPNIGWVDLLVDDWLIVEVDSRKHHGAPAEQHRDRLRDGHAVLGKYGVVRFDFPLVQFELDWCVRVTLERLASGRP